MINQLYKLCAPCLFGLESVLSGELKRLGFEDISVTDGRVEFTADAEGVARANLNLRTAERVLIVLDSFRAVTFQQLIDGAEKIPFARRAGISGLIRLEKADVKNFTIPDRKSLVVTNPPYGERLMNGEDLTKLYQTMGNVFQPSQQTAYYIISSAENFEQSFGRKADKKRKLYNGMLKCNLYQYFAQKSK